MTQVIFPTIVYRQIISLIIHCITIPVAQKCTASLLDIMGKKKKSPQVWFTLGSND
jgi:hypothetical protein